MKRKNFIFATLVFLSATSFAQYESTNKSLDTDYKLIDEIIGKEFWIKPNPNAISRNKFKSDYLASPLKDEFVVTTDTKFVVLGYEVDSYKRVFVKVQFEDGKVAYTMVLLSSYSKNVFNNVFDGSEYYDFNEYLFRGKPDEVLAAWKSKKANKKAQADAEYRAKGGVKIGMTKEQVLKSNWGKPESVNTTTNAGSVREQWVYGGRNYLYFTNGILTGIQN